MPLRPHSPPLATLAASLAGLLAASLVPAHRACAQDAAPRLHVEAGPVWSARRDASISPLAFAGTGWRIGLGHERRRDGGTRSIMVRAGALALRPASAPSSERSIAASVDASALRGSRGVQGGLALRGTLLVTRHQFHEVAVAVPVYRFSTLGVGPALRGARRMPGGEMTFRLAVPLVGWIDRPYSAIKSGHARFGPRPAGPSTLRTLDGGLAWEARGWRGRVVRVAYDVELVASDLHGTLRSLQHGVSVGASRGARRSDR